jgi:hypothetical protein
MFYYQVFTLFDITATGVIRHPRPTDVNYQSQLLKRNQQRNWETVQQVLAMRAQIYVEHPPEIIKTCNQFSRKIFKNTQAWGFQFAVEHVEIYGSNLQLLFDDCHGIPMILGLTERAAIAEPVIDCWSNYKNIHIESVETTK